MTKSERRGRTIHATATQGFGQNAREYEQARPTYPPDAVQFLADRMHLTAGRTVLDVGAGTGKLTRLLLPTGADVVAVEPVASMREELLRLVPAAITVAGAAEALPLASGGVDAIVCAQAFHWFATVEVLIEFGRVLRADGGLALVWNLRDNTVPWVREFTELLREHEGDRPDHNTGQWRAAFTGSESPFLPPETTAFFHAQPMTPELLVARAASMSFVGAMDESTRTAVLSKVRELGEAQGRAFELPYRTEIHLANRR
jgi:SAM-dependent methyltransferase